MTPLEIIVIICSVLIVGGVIVSQIIAKKNGKSSCGHDCSACRNSSTCRKHKKQ